MEATKRQRRIQIIQQAGASCVPAGCTVTCVCGPGCCGSPCDCGPAGCTVSCGCRQGGQVFVCDDQGQVCTCLCGCEGAEITEQQEDGHTIFTIRVPGSRSGADPLVKAAGVSDAVENLSGSLGRLVREARGAGASWTDIGAALGISKQAAWERFSGEN